MLVQVAVLVILVSAAKAACRNGWIMHNESCYHVSHDTESWIGALNFCKIFGGYLVEIDDASENNFVKALLEQAHFGEAWIGTSDALVEGEWMLVNSEQQVTYANWKSGQPDNASHNENCAEIRSDGEWNDDSCHESQQYVCESTVDGDGGATIVG